MTDFTVLFQPIVHRIHCPVLVDQTSNVGARLIARLVPVVGARSALEEEARWARNRLYFCGLGTCNSCLNDDCWLLA